MQRSKLKAPIKVENYDYNEPHPRYNDIFPNVINSCWYLWSFRMWEDKCVNPNFDGNKYLLKYISMHKNSLPREICNN